MALIRKFSSNGYIAIIPILAWNVIFATSLPLAYQVENFNSNIPGPILFSENCFRLVIFSMPLLFQLGISTAKEKAGLAIYTVGIVVYFCSWLMLMEQPNTAWSQSVFGFTAPATTTIIWLLGISLMAKSYYFNCRYRTWHFLLPSMAFFISHAVHSVFVYHRTYG